MFEIVVAGERRDDKFIVKKKVKHEVTEKYHPLYYYFKPLSKHVSNRGNVE